MRPAQPARHLLTQEASGECCCLRGASTQLDRPSPRRGPTERCMEGDQTLGSPVSTFPKPQRGDPFKAQSAQPCKGDQTLG